MALPLAPRTTPTRPAQQGQTRSDRAGNPPSQPAASLFGRIVGSVLLGIAIWGFWVAAEIPRYADTAVLGPQQSKLRAAVILLSWMVLFGPFLYFGIRILRRSFAPQERSWMIPLRVFSYIVGKRFSLENQRREFLNNPGAKPLPPATSDYIDVTPSPSRVKDANSKSSQ
jgi:hypothetical protein